MTEDTVIVLRVNRVYNRYVLLKRAFNCININFFILLSYVLSFMFGIRSFTRAPEIDFHIPNSSFTVTHARFVVFVRTTVKAPAVRFFFRGLSPDRRIQSYEGKNSVIASSRPEKECRRKYLSDLGRKIHLLRAFVSNDPKRSFKSFVSDIDWSSFSARIEWRCLTERRRRIREIRVEASTVIRGVTAVKALCPHRRAMGEFTFYFASRHFHWDLFKGQIRIGCKSKSTSWTTKVDCQCKSMFFISSRVRL